MPDAKAQRRGREGEGGRRMGSRKPALGREELPMPPVVGCWPGSQGAEPHRSVKSTPANQRLQLQVQLQPLLVPKARQLLNWALVVPLGC